MSSSVYEQNLLEKQSTDPFDLTHCASALLIANQRWGSHFNALKRCVIAGDSTPRQTAKLSNPLTQNTKFFCFIMNTVKALLRLFSIKPPPHLDQTPEVIKNCPLAKLHKLHVNFDIACNRDCVEFVYFSLDIVC